MNKLVKHFLLMLVITTNLLSSDNLLSNQKVNISDDTARNAVMALNHMHSALNKIVLYNDKIVLEEEYDNIINNINLTVIQDQEIVNTITYLMDTLTAFKLTEMEKEQFQREYQEELDNAISGALSGLSISGSDPITMGISLITSAGSAYMSYKDDQSNAKKGLDKGKWELKKSAITELNEIRKDFLLTYWKIMKKYKMPDQWRITEKQFTRFVNILKGNDIDKKYRQLLRMKKEMQVFPNYWYELSLIAHQLDKKDDELKAIAKYESLDDQLLRHNSLYSLMLANKIKYLNPKTNKSEIISILEKIYKVDPLNPERKLFLAMQYLQIGDMKKAENLLNENIDDDFLPVVSQRLKINMYLKDNKDKDYKDTINDLLNKQNISAREYLFYLGKRPLPLIVKEIEKQVKGIEITIKKTLYGNNSLQVSLPKQWVYQDIEDTELIVEIDGKEFNFTEISKEENKLIYDYNKIINQDKLLNEEIKSLNLKLIHKKIPINILYNINIIKDEQNALTESSTKSKENSSYWDKIGDVANDTIKKGKEEYKDYKSEINFTSQKILLENQCFDLKNSLKPCK